jgi:hypothetical protein
LKVPIWTTGTAVRYLGVHRIFVIFSGIDLLCMSRGEKFQQFDGFFDITGTLCHPTATQVHVDAPILLVGPHHLDFSGDILVRLRIGSQ